MIHVVLQGNTPCYLNLQVINNIIIRIEHLQGGAKSNILTVEIMSFQPIGLFHKSIMVSQVHGGINCRMGNVILM